MVLFYVPLTSSNISPRRSISLFIVRYIRAPTKNVVSTLVSVCVCALVVVMGEWNRSVGQVLRVISIYFVQELNGIDI